MHLTNLITAVDLHACGEPGRVITGGVMDVPGRTMFEKMKYFEANRDEISLRMLRRSLSPKLRERPTIHFICMAVLAWERLI